MRSTIFPNTVTQHMQSISWINKIKSILSFTYIPYSTIWPHLWLAKTFPFVKITEILTTPLDFNLSMGPSKYTVRKGTKIKPKRVLFQTG